jgi:hypothetical protein
MLSIGLTVDVRLRRDLAGDPGYPVATTVSQAMRADRSFAMIVLIVFLLERNELAVA